MLIRIAFLVTFSDRLLGSLNYYRNLLEAVSNLSNKKIEPVVFTGHESDLSLMIDFPAVEVIKTQLLNRKTPVWLFHKISQKLMWRDLILERLLVKHNISVLSHAGSLGQYSKIKTIGWIPDFQHKHLPDLFSKLQLHKREKLYRKLCRECSCVVVSSHDAFNDLRKFYPQYASKAHVLQFVASPCSKPSLLSNEEIVKKYNIVKPYFHLPNQFWVHKNHKVVIEALKVLHNKGETILIVATGKTYDHRQPNHYDNLMSKVKELGLSDKFRVLGVVPYRDLVSIMNNSIAIINPSYFEGWSSSVEEAKSLGKRILLSDIPVHREQDPPGGQYFDPDKGNSLADLLETILEEHDLEKDKELAIAAYEVLCKRKEAFSMKYQDIVLDLFDSHENSDVIWRKSSVD